MYRCGVRGKLQTSGFPRPDHALKDSHPKHKQQFLLLSLYLPVDGGLVGMSVCKRRSDLEKALRVLSLLELILGQLTGHAVQSLPH